MRMEGSRYGRGDAEAMDREVLKMLQTRRDTKVATRVSKLPNGGVCHQRSSRSKNFGWTSATAYPGALRRSERRDGVRPVSEAGMTIRVPHGKSMTNEK